MFAYVNLLLPGPFRSLFLSALGPLYLALVEARQVLVAGVGVELDLLDGVRGLPFLGRGYQRILLSPWAGEEHLDLRSARSDVCVYI